MGWEYTLKVCHAGQPFPTETVRVTSSTAVIEAIPVLLAKHTDCHRIHVDAGSIYLFSVDCAGKSVRD